MGWGGGGGVALFLEKPRTLILPVHQIYATGFSADSRLFIYSSVSLLCVTTFPFESFSFDYPMIFLR